MNDYNELPLATSDDEELALRIRALEREVLASVRSDNWNIEAQLDEGNAQHNA